MFNADFSFFHNVKVLVIGDLILDTYLEGTVNRISPEAPVPILKVSSTKHHLGGAGNVCNNLVSLRCNVKILSRVGKDPNGVILKGLLDTYKINSSGVYQSDVCPTIQKVRFASNNHQMLRADFEEICSDSDFEIFAINYIKEILTQVDGVIISDYNKGVVTEKISAFVVNLCNKLKKYVFVDPKGKNYLKYSGSTICTPNLTELSEIAGKQIGQNDELVKKEAYNLIKKYNFKYVIVTRSEEGMSVVDINGNCINYKTAAKEVVDVSGAGDTVISVISLMYIAGFDLETICSYANIAASIVISKFGTAPITYSELDLCCSHTKLKTVSDMEHICIELRKQGKHIVFTNGCFDLLHLGHIKVLKKSKEFGDVLIVGLNSDASVKKLKGSERPIVSEIERSEMLSSLSFVDYIVIFSEDSPESLIESIKPDVLVKGDDWKGKCIAGQSFVESYGGSVKYVERIPGLSTTDLINRIRNTL